MSAKTETGSLRTFARQTSLHAMFGILQDDYLFF